MTNQQLIDFIKQQLQLGLTKEKITNELFANGWNTQDIEEGFAATGIPVATPAASTLPPNIPQMINPNLNQTVNTNPEVKPAMNVNLNPNLASVANEPISIKTKSNLDKIVFIVLSVLLIAVIIISIYFLRDEIVKLPVIKDFFPQEEAVIQDNVVLPETTQQSDVVKNKDNQNLDTVTPIDINDLNTLENDVSGTDMNIDFDINNIN